MIGISGIGTYLPAFRVEARKLGERFQVDDAFLEKKTGFTGLARKDAGETVADMCCAAFADLGVPATDVDFLCLCTQNPDMALPQTSAVLQHRLGIGETCAAFDISLGCSGYVYSLVAAQAFMERAGLKNGLVFTCDPYSPHLSPEDKNTQLLFGDGATVTHLSTGAFFSIETPAFATLGAMAPALHKEHGGTIHMDGREIFNFTMRSVPPVVQRCVAANGLDMSNIDLFLLHQATRYVVDNMAKKLGVAAEKAPFFSGDYGNTVSSSIPLGLKEHFTGREKNIILCGFGVGLSVASVLIRRISK